MKRGFIFAAGTFFGLRLRPAPGDLVIAADAGALTCDAIGLKPDLLLGDFDSMEAPPVQARVIRLPVEKDDTDTVAAARLCAEQGCEEVYIYGGTGGSRLDHTLANLQTLLFLRRRGVKGYLYDQDFIWTALENETLHIPREVEWGLLSVFAMGETVSGVTLRGVQYPLENAELRADFPLGVSNHVLEETAQVTVGCGAVAVGWQLLPLPEESR